MKKYLTLILLLIMPYTSFAQVPITNLVTPVSYFVDHVKQLSLVRSNLNKYKKASVVGVSGMGKTQLSRMYAYENKNNYQIIWFFDCNLDVNEEFVKLAKAINKQDGNNVISEDALQAKKETMSYLLTKDQWLLVFDNLKVKENNRMQEFINWEHNGHVIFGAQDSELLPNIVKMTAFEKSDAIALANNILENSDTKLAQFLAQEFTGYPILIVQGAQLLKQVPGLDKEEYRKKIQQSPDKIKLNITLAIKELKPSARELLNKIALINNQGFSKDLLKIITDYKDNLDDDIYQLSKFSLIDNIDPNETNPIFEMHDVIAQKIIEINGEKNNRSCLEEIVLKINLSTRGFGTQQGHILRTAATMLENLEIILKNVEKYNIDIYPVMELKKNLFVVYVNTQNKYGCEHLIAWFDEQEKNKKFKLLLMNKEYKGNYAAYLGLIGVYNQIILVNFKTAIVYFNRALEILDGLEERINLRYNLTSHVVESQSFLGNIESAKVAIDKMEKLFDHGVDKADITLLHYAKSIMYLTQGQYIAALKYSDKYKEESIKYGLYLNNLFMTVPYMLRAETLNWLGKYQEAYVQAQQLYDMHKPVKKEDHLVFGQIFTQMARSELGLGKTDQASEHVNKAIAIFLADENRNPKDADYSEDPELAASYVAQGDILFAQDNTQAAIESYIKAFDIFYHLYGDNRENVAQVSYLYSQGAKAACRVKDLFNYKFFGKRQIREFGIHHPNTVSMLEYCKNYNMDLWGKGS